MAVIAGRYELLRPLGSGGMAEVVAAHDRRLGRDVAIKLIRPEQLADPTSHERLLREARAAAALHHPHTVAVHDVGEDGGRPFIVMELVKGDTLQDRLRDGTRLSADETVAIGSAVLEALQTAHEHGLVHRDVKPSNVLLSDSGHIKLADFGIAKALDTTDAGLTTTGQVIGTPRYLAPEQAAGGPATPASDLYSLGAVLYECLAGRPPFDGPSALAVALAHQRASFPPLREVAPDVPGSVADTVERALSKDPQQRFADADQMRAGLRGELPAALPGDPSAHAPATPPATVPIAVPGTTAQLPRSTTAEATQQLPHGQDGGATQLLDDEPTRRSEQTADPGERRTGGVARTGRSRQWWLAAALAAGLAAVLLLAGLSALLDRDGPPPGAGEDTEQPADAAGGEDDQAAEGDADGAEGAPPEQAEANPPDPTAEEALDDLIAELARDPDAAGQQGNQLLRKLMEVRDADEDARAEEARKLVKEIASWLERDHLDAEVGEDSIGVLEQVGRPEAPELEEASLLFAEVAFDKEAWGKKAKDLLDDLDDLLGESEAGDWAEDATDIIEEIDDWIAKDELDADRGRHAQEILAPLASGSA
jgi:eukaryotic-like serine/threonine-protein kinase